MVKNYIAKIALLAILRYVELLKPGFTTDEFLAEIEESELKDFQLFDKYPIKDIDRLTQALLDATEGDKTFFFRLGLDGISFKIGSYSFFLQNSINLRDVINKSLQYSHIISDIISMDAEEVGEYLKITYQLSRDVEKLENTTCTSILEISYGTFVALYNEMTDSSKHSIEFYSAYTHELSEGHISELLGYEFTANADKNYILIPLAMVDIKNPKYEADLPATISQGLSKHLEAQNTSSLVSIISNLLDAKPSCSLEDISQQLHISKRTLQRRLKDQSINFTALKQDVAIRRSIELLDSGKHTIEEIALQLGYSSTATFVHAFSKWHDLSPSAYLKKK